MNVNSVSSVSNNFNSNKLSKANNSPSFGALRADAADAFIQKAAENLDPKSQNTVLEQLIKLAERAKQSLVLDIKAGDKYTGYCGGEGKQVNTLRFVDTTKAKDNSFGFYLGDILGFEKKKDSNDVNIILNKASGLMEPSSAKGIEKVTVQAEGYGSDYDVYEAPIQTYMNRLIEHFNETESEIVDRIETEKVTQALTEKLNGLTKTEKTTQALRDKCSGLTK